MRVIEVHPRQRDMMAKKAYKVLDWYFRSEGKKIMRKVEEEFWNEILYGRNNGQIPNAVSGDTE